MIICLGKVVNMTIISDRVITQTTCPKDHVDNIHILKAAPLQCGAVISRSKSSQHEPHSLPIRDRYGVFLMSTN